MSAVYLAADVRDQIAQAQAVIDRHPAGVDGVCLRCGPVAGCGRDRALQLLARYGQLPRRRPGVTRTATAEQSNAGFGWFATTGGTR